MHRTNNRNFYYFCSIVRSDTDTLQQTISQVSQPRTISSDDEIDAGAITGGSFSRNQFTSRRESSQSERIGDVDAIHKSKSQGNLTSNRKDSALSAPSNRTQIHKFITRKSKKGLSRAKSVPEKESSSSVDKLLEMPFEEMAKAGLKNPRRHTVNEENVSDSQRKIGPGSGEESQEGLVEFQNVATSNVFNKYHQVENAEYSHGVCLDCLRNGNKCIDCVHKNPRPVSESEVHFEDSDASGSRLYNRQFSDILLIPGPFDYHDKISSIEDTNSV